MIKYRKIGGYKYALEENSLYETDITGSSYHSEYLSLTVTGLLLIKKGYAWDGATFIFDKDAKEASLVHDALYQLIRLKALEITICRKIADKILYNILRETQKRRIEKSGLKGIALAIDKMLSYIRAQYVYCGVRWFGDSSAKQIQEKDMDKVYTE